MLGERVNTTSFSDVVEKSKKLEEYLSSNGITLHPESELARAIKKSNEVLSLHETGAIPNGYDSHSAVSNISNVYIFAT